MITHKYPQVPSWASLSILACSLEVQMVWKLAGSAHGKWLPKSMVTTFNNATPPVSDLENGRVTRLRFKSEHGQSWICEGSCFTLDVSEGRSSSVVFCQSLGFQGPLPKPLSIAGYGGSRNMVPRRNSCMAGMASLKVWYHGTSFLQYLLGWKWVGNWAHGKKDVYR